MRRQSFPPVGSLRDRVQWQRRDMVAEPEGGHSNIYVPMATIWARVRSLSTRQAQMADARAMATSHGVVLRYRSDIKPGDRFIHRGRALTVLSTEDMEGRHAFLSCACSETEAVG